MKAQKINGYFTYPRTKTSRDRFHKVLNILKATVPAKPQPRHFPLPPELFGTKILKCELPSKHW